MIYLPSKRVLFLLVGLVLAMSANAQVLDNQTRFSMERELTQLLLEKDVGEVANQLAREPTTLVLPLLRRLSIFARAGHRTRVSQTLNQLAEASDMPPIRERWVVAQAVKEIIGNDDLTALRTYYERIMPIDAANADDIVRLWESEGDPKELDAWLAAREGHHPGWFQLRIYWRMKLGTINALLDALAAEVRTNPLDMERAFRYLLANSSAGRPQNVAWLGDFFEKWLGTASAPRVAYEFYELGGRLQTDLPELAARLFERSLALPFTERDMQLIRERVIIRFSVSPRVKNWEKQLRFWVKKHLAETYRATGQPQAAQRLIEELVAMKGDDIMTEDVHSLAGAVQTQSGMRVVEAKILRDEATERDSAAYWVERAQYYKGRKEYDVVMDTYRQAFAHLPIKADDKASVSARLFLLDAFKIFVKYADEDGKRQERLAEVKRTLRREFSLTPPETEYAFRVARIVADNELKFDDLRDSLLVKDKSLLPRMLAARDPWTNEEEWLIENVICRENLSSELKSNYWTQLEDLTKSGSASRAYHLAGAMLWCNEPRRAVPLLVSYLKHVREQPHQGADYLEEQTVSNLFSAYLGAGDWRAAEKLLFGQKSLTGRQLIYDLPRVAVVAAREGYMNDALRLWRVKSNQDRRHLDGLNELSATKAAEPLREMYTQMKKEDPLSFVPVRALRLLQ